MDKKKRDALETAGFRVGDYGDFLGLTVEERRLVELRLAIGRTVRERRESQHLTQQQLAQKMKSSQSRVAKIEAGGVGISLDLLFRGLFAVGGTVEDLIADKAGRGTGTRKPTNGARAASRKTRA